MNNKKPKHHEKDVEKRQEHDEVTKKVNIDEDTLDQTSDDSIEDVIEVDVLSSEEMEEIEKSEAEEANSEGSTENKDDNISKEQAMAIALVKAEQALKEANDRYQRTMAEFDNFRKRTLKEKSAMFENGAKEVLEKLLPVIDNFERALSHIKEEEKELSITQGVEMIYKQMMASFKELGVEEIDAFHKEFDPNYHHAVSHEDNEAYDDNLVQEVFQKGYLYKESVLRHSMVKVVN